MTQKKKTEDKISIYMLLFITQIQLSASLRLFIHLLVQCNSTKPQSIQRSICILVPTKSNIWNYRIVVPQKKLKCTRAETRIVTLYNPIPILQDSSHYGCSMNGWAIIHGPYHKFQLAFNTASHFCRLANLLNKNLYVQFLEERSEHKLPKKTQNF